MRIEKKDGAYLKGLQNDLPVVMEDNGLMRYVLVAQLSPLLSILMIFDNNLRHCSRG